MSGAKRSSKELRDWMLIAFFVAFDIALVWAALHYLRARSHGMPGDDPVEALGPASSSAETEALDELAKLSLTGSWESLERARFERAKGFLRSGTRPSAGAAVYFFPETLPERAIELDFVRAELKPGLEALRQAYDSRRDADALQAYRNLESRIENYELGSSQDAGTAAPAERLSPEARKFLAVYKAFAASK